MKEVPNYRCLLLELKCSLLILKPMLNLFQVKILILGLLQKTTEECASPDVRDRAYMYWRLLSTNPELARTVLSGEKGGEMENYVFKELDQMLAELGMSSSVE